jgi:hypothetical protein
VDEKALFCDISALTISGASERCLTPGRCFFHRGVLFRGLRRKR